MKVFQIAMAELNEIALKRKLVYRCFNMHFCCMFSLGNFLYFQIYRKYLRIGISEGVTLKSCDKI